MTMIVRVAALSAFVASYASGLTLGTSDYFSLDCDGYDSIGLCSEAFMEQCRAAKGENPGCVGAMCSGKETCTDICGCNGRKCIYFSPPTTKSPVYEEAVEAPTTSAPTKAPTCPAGTYGTIPAGPFVDEFYDPVLVPKDTDFDNEAFCPGGGLMCKYVMTSGPEAGSVVGHIPAEGLSGASFTCVMGDSDTSTVITLDPRTPSIGAPTEFTLNSGSDYTIRVVAGVTSMNKLVTIYSVLGDGSLGSSNKFTLVNTESGEVFTKLHVCMEPMGVGCRPLDLPVLPKPSPCPAGTYGHINAPLEEEFFTPEHVPAVSEFASTCPGDGVMCAFQGLMGLLDYIPGEALNGESFTCIMGAGDTTSITLSPRSPVSGSPTSFTLNSGNNYTMRVVTGVTDKSKVLTVYAVRDDGKLGSSNVFTLSNTEEGEVFIRLHVCVEPMGVGCRPKEIPPLLGGLSTPTLSPTKEPCPAGTHGVIVGTKSTDGDATNNDLYPRVEEFYVPSAIPDVVEFGDICPGESEMCVYKDADGTIHDYIPAKGLQGDSFSCHLSLDREVLISLIPRVPDAGNPASLMLGCTDLYSMRVVAGVTSMFKVVYSYAVLFDAGTTALGSSNMLPLSTVDANEFFTKLQICIEPMKDACRPQPLPILPRGPLFSPTKAPVSLDGITITNSCLALPDSASECSIRTTQDQQNSAMCPSGSVMCAGSGKEWEFAFGGDIAGLNNQIRYCTVSGTSDRVAISVTETKSKVGYIFKIVDDVNAPLSYAMTAVNMKAATNSNFCMWDSAAVLSSGEVMTPLDPQNKKNYDLSHANICVTLCNSYVAVSTHSPEAVQTQEIRATPAPTLSPTVTPTLSPTVTPTLSPTGAPTLSPTGAPTLSPTATPTSSPTKEPCPAGTHGVIVGNSGIDGDASDPLKFPRVEEFYVPSVVPDDVTFAAMCPGEGGSEMCKYKDMMGTLYDYIPEEGLQGDSFTCLLSNGSVEISLVPRDPITEGPPVSLQLGSTDLYSMRVVAGVTSMSKVIYSYAVLFQDPLALGSSNVFPMSTVDTDEVFIKLHICIEPMKDACRPKNVPVLPLGPASSPTKAPTGQPSPAPTDPCPAGTYGVPAGVNDANNGDASGFPTVEDFYTQENLLNSFQVLVASPDGFCPEKGEMCKFNMDDFIPDSALSGTSFNCTLEDGKEVKISLSNKDPTDTSPYSGITLYSGLEHSFSLVSCLRSDAMVSYSYHVAFETSGEDLRPYAFGASDYATCTVESVAGETRATIVGLYVCVEPMGHACRHEHNEYIPNQLPYLKGPMHSPTMAPVPTTAAPHPLSAEVVTTPQPTSGPTEEYCKCADKSVNIEGAGKVTGGGWIYLTGTSYLNCQLAAGNPTGNKALDCGLLDTTINPSALNQIRVNYGFVGMYRKGIPMGSTNFDLEGGNFHFHSDMRNTPYKFLEVLEDGIHARWMGQGALSVKARTQGKGGWEYGYCFMVAVHDNGEPGYLDTFRLRVWDCSGKTKLSQCTLSDPLSSSVSLHTFASVGDRPECLVFDTNSDFPVPSLDTDNAVPSQTINLERFNGTEVGELGEQHGGGNIQIHLKSKKNVYMDYMRQSGMPCTACEGFEEELAISDNGFVTGGGWILLDEQAYLKPATCTCLSQGKPSRADRFLDQDLKIVGDGTGICDSPDLGLAKANYGFNAKHINGVPQGSFNFDINGNGFHFHSDAIFDNNSEFDCLEVVCDDRYSSSYMEVVARWTGIGKIARTMEPPQDNSRSWVPGYRFWISVQDNGEPGFLDTIRIRIEDKDCPGTILFDTDFNSGVIFTGAEPGASLCPTYSDKDYGPIADPFCEVAGNVCSDADYQGTSLVGQWNGTQAGLEDLVKKGGGNIQMHCKGGPTRA